MWKVSSNWVGGDTIYQVYRRKYASEVDHSGDRVVLPVSFASREDAQEEADRLNKREEYGNEC